MGHACVYMWELLCVIALLCCVHACVGACVVYLYEGVDKCMHRNVFLCVTLSLCVYTNIYLLFLVLSWTNTGWIWPFNIVQRSKQAKDHENWATDQFSQFPSYAPGSFLLDPFLCSLKKNYLTFSTLKVSLLKTVPNRPKYNEVRAN